MIYDMIQTTNGNSVGLDIAICCIIYFFCYKNGGNVILESNCFLLFPWTHHFFLFLAHINQTKSTPPSAIFLAIFGDKNSKWEYVTLTIEHEKVEKNPPFFCICGRWRWFKGYCPYCGGGFFLN